MPSVAVNPPKTPVTKGSSGMASATMPNVCKMPGPPAPFVPTPLPNIGQSGKSPDGYSTSVTVEGDAVAIAGASFGSSGDIASKGTGGGMVSNNAEGPTKFLAPGSLNVKIEGKNVQYLGDQMLNNCGPSGSPANSATMTGVNQASASAEQVLRDIALKCDADTPPEKHGKKKTCLKLGEDKHKCCEGRIQEHRSKNPPDGQPPVQGEQGYKRPQLDETNTVVEENFQLQPTGGARPDLRAAFKAGGDAIREAFAGLRGNCFPDAAIINPDGSRQFVDFKFPCPPGHPSGKGVSQGGAKTAMSPRQQASYDALGQASGCNLPSIVLP